MTSKRLIKISFPILLVVGIYFLGPHPVAPKYVLAMPALPNGAGELEKYIADREGRHQIKPNNEARIIWNDSSKQKTPYAVVYLHGFSASHMEGDPIHQQFAKAFGCNLYLSRLADHGIDTTEALLYFTADRAWESAKEALAIGKKIGEESLQKMKDHGAKKIFLFSNTKGSAEAIQLYRKLGFTEV